MKIIALTSLDLFHKSFIIPAHEFAASKIVHLRGRHHRKMSAKAGRPLVGRIFVEFIRWNYARVLLAACMLTLAPAHAQNSPAQVLAAPSDATNNVAGQANTAPGSYRIPGTAPNPQATPSSNATAPLQTDVSPAQMMPPPIHDDKVYSYTLFDLLEYRPNGSDSDVRWDIESWRGRDFRRFFIKTEGERSTVGDDYDADLQLLASRLVKPFTEFQYGVRLEGRKFRGANVVRPQAVVGVEARVPYNYEIESALYLDPHGNLSADFTATKDLLLTQRLILQGRFEANATLQEVERFGLGSGVNDVELGARLRYEIRREFAPYIGISYGRSFGGTASYVRSSGGDVSQTRFVAGVHAWF